MKRCFLTLTVALLFQACSGSKEDNSGDSQNQSTKFSQYMVVGQDLYLQHCSNCHQVDGSGLAQLYPPLAKSDYLEENLAKSICSMKYGLMGEIEVNGVTYNQNMPGIPTLTPLEIAEITTYITNSWGNEHGLVTIQEVEEALKSCKN